ncbi:adenine deaminase [Desulfallas sp. Bu1-1]|uniref:adenine deaminase C-terminal domain-containing protein n=1 Tax=Desulfallas sp. Bu1-1 TaxID=2787620 RepID=UPI00189D9D47|nr:adenine deaminase C-terminal domain-containing protein [Desulfallas sp. Bu1-1]MBF7083134.1 adenine deaminase [Desulfallas sp. Bu1-1]
MKTHLLRPLDRQNLHELILTAKGEINCDLYIKGGTIINVYTGELLPANVAIKGKHIAYVGDRETMVGERTRLIDATGMYLCPGYIEPHAHPFQTYNPVTLVNKVMTLGTTTLVCDNLFFFMSMDEKKLLGLWHELAQLPVKVLWSVRLDPQTFSRQRMERFNPRRIETLLDSVLARQVGELTDWPSLVTGDKQMLDNILTARRLGKKVEGHAPGASVQTLNALAAGGVSDCHESITGEEVLNRLRLGMYVTLRHSSLRPDLPGLLKELLNSGVDLRRAMMTTDGVTPPSMKHGFTDYLVRLAIDAGVPAVEAYRMVTINPATYYGMDDELGGIAPGRLADILFLEDPQNPTPVKVIAEGVEVFERGREPLDLPGIEWQKYGIIKISGFSGEIKPGDMVPPAREGAFPVMRLVNPVITRRKDQKLPVKNNFIDIAGEPGLVYATMLNREGGWVCNGVLEGFADKLDGLACSNTITGDILALGRNPQEMQRAVKRMFDLGGGLVITENGGILYELPLPLSGIMSPASIDELTAECSELYRLLAQRGHVHYDLLYTILFLSATHLPEIRLSPGGILSVKDKKILVPSRKI